MKQPRYVVLDLKEKFRRFRNYVADIPMTVGLVSVSQLLQEVLESILSDCQYWDISIGTMCRNCLQVVDRYVQKGDFEPRLDLYTVSTELAFVVRQKVEKHSLEEGDRFLYEYKQHSPDGLLVLKLT